MHVHTDIRPAAVAGSFYPADADLLRREIARCLDGHQLNPFGSEQLKALIVPHAGTIYSGTTAGAAYAQLPALREKIRRVVLLGPCHRVAVQGLAIPSVASFATPLGKISLDRAALDTLLDLPQIVVSNVAHAKEHALEVQLPFLQSVLGEFAVVPLVVGAASAQEVAEVLERLWGGAETLIVISSDLSHFHRYQEARQIDDASVAQIMALIPLSSDQQACGALPINGLLEVARRRGLHIDKLAQCNSGDTAGDRERVVGYAAFAVYQTQDMEESSEDVLGSTLLTLARSAIAEKLNVSVERGAQVVLPELAILKAPGACFVTLTLQGQLRGCIGSLEPHRPLYQDVQANAVAAAFRDPRFAPIDAQVFSQLRVEVSLLSSAVELTFTDEADALRQLRPHQDGLILQSSGRRGTFLPQVWKQLPDPIEFLAHLKQKAGLPRDWWSSDLQLFRYEVQKWTEA